MARRRGSSRAAAAASVLTLALVLAAVSGCAGRPHRPAASTPPSARTPGIAGGPPTVAPAPAGLIGAGTVRRMLPGCSTAVQPAPELPASDVTLQPTASEPF